VVGASSEEINLDVDDSADDAHEQDVPAAVFGGGLTGAMDRLKRRPKQQGSGTAELLKSTCD
jgi:hypothetical protein